VRTRTIDGVLNRWSMESTPKRARGHALGGSQHQTMLTQGARVHPRWSGFRFLHHHFSRALAKHKCQSSFFCEFFGESYSKRSQMKDAHSSGKPMNHYLPTKLNQ